MPDRGEISGMVIMVLAAIQADGKALENLTVEEIRHYVDAAVADFAFALNVVNRAKPPPAPGRKS